MYKRLFRWALALSVLLAILLQLESTPVPDSSNNGIAQGVQNILTCDPLSAQGTSVLCFPPSTRPGQQFDTSTNCVDPSVPGTIASYSCRNQRGVVYTGFLNCAQSGIWMTSLQYANNSLCNLDSTIINFEIPDVVIANEVLEFTTPSPNKELLQSDISFLSGYEALTLQLHNTFRRNHGVPAVTMTQQLNTVAQQFAESIVSGMDIQDAENNFKLDPVHAVMNVEMNWYFQVPISPNPEEAASNAVQSWYSGFLKYDWENLERNLEVGDALAFARIIWRATQLIGVGVASSNSLTFVACVYTPGRNVASTDPIREFELNVPTFRLG